MGVSMPRWPDIELPCRMCCAVLQSGTVRYLPDLVKVRRRTVVIMIQTEAMMRAHRDGQLQAPVASRRRSL